MKKFAVLAATAVFALAMSGGPALAQKTPERSNKSGEVRGQDRANQVKDMNEKKKSSAGEKAEGKAKANKKKD